MLINPVIAQDKPKEENKKGVESVVTPVKTIDFRAQLDPTFEALDQVAAMIDNGRKFGDVNSLLSASMVLFLAENSSGKKAQLSALDLLKEATDMAKKQKNTKALKTCSEVWANPLFANNSAEAKTLNEHLANLEEELASTRGPGAKVVDVKIENYTSYTVYIYIDGVYKGYLKPGYYVVYNNIGAGWTSFYAETDEFWSYSKGQYIYYKWNNSYNLTNYDYTYATDFTWSIY